MKKVNLSKIILSTAVLIGLLSLMTACAGIFGSHGRVMVTIPGMGSTSKGLYVDAATMTKGYVVVAQNDEMYTFEEYPDTHDLIGGQAYISNIPEGTYLFYIILLNEADNITGLALKEVVINPGYNEVEITVGPGVSNFSVEGIELQLDPVEPSDAYSVSFSENTITFDYGRPSGDVKVKYYPTFGENARGIKSTTAYSINKDLETTTTKIGNETATVGVNDAGVQFNIVDDADVTYVYRVILK